MYVLGGEIAALFKRPSSKSFSSVQTSFSKKLGSLKLHLCTHKSYITAMSHEEHSDDKYHLVVEVCNGSHQVDCKELWKAAKTGRMDKHDLIELRSSLQASKSSSARRPVHDHDNCENDDDDKLPSDVDESTSFAAAIFGT